MLFVLVDSFIVGSHVGLRTGDLGFLEFECGEAALLPLWTGDTPSRVLLKFFESADDPSRAEDLAYIARAVPISVRQTHEVELQLSLPEGDGAAAVTSPDEREAQRRPKVFGDDADVDWESDAEDEVAVADLEMSMAGGLKALKKKRLRQKH